MVCGYVFVNGYVDVVIGGDVVVVCDRVLLLLLLLMFLWNYCCGL